MFHIVCGLLGAGFSIAYSQREFPLSAHCSYKKDLSYAYMWALTGPVFLLTICALFFFMFGASRAFKHGIKFY